MLKNSHYKKEKLICTNNLSVQLTNPSYVPDLSPGILYVVEQKVNKYNPTRTMHQQNPWQPTNKSASSLKYGPC